MRPSTAFRVTSAIVMFMICGYDLMTNRAAAQTEPPPAPPPWEFQYLPLIQSPSPAQLLIAAAHIDSAISYEPDEAILLWNTGMRPQALAGWALKSGTKTARFPITATIILDPGARLWCTAQAGSFQQSFGVTPGCTWGDAIEGAVHLDNKLSLNNMGGSISLLDPEGAVVDALLYGNTSQTSPGWIGEPAAAYTRGLVSTQGQIWQRKPAALTGQPVDSNQAIDWAGDMTDLVWGRRVRFPGWGGWDSTDGMWPATGSDQATITVAIGPEGLYAPMANFLARATRTLDLSLYTLEHPALAIAAADAARRGVQVRLLLEGSPPGGISDLQKWCVTQIVAAGGDVRFSAVTDDAPNGYKRRYRFLHAKYGIADGRSTFVGSENLTLDAMPIPTGNSNGGRRGFYLFTDAGVVNTALQALFQHDWQPDVFADIRPYAAEHARYGAPPPEFVLPEAPIYSVDDAPFDEPLSSNAQIQFIVVSAPENATRPDSGIHHLINQAGAGDTITLMQLYENAFWGESGSNAIADPNPRLEAAIDAARRGATVRLLLDSYFDDAEDLRNNQLTVDYVRSIAASEGLDLDARLGNPTGGGIHAKLVLVSVGSQRWSAVGSLNGSEASHKINREVVLIVDEPGIYARLLSVFDHDWALGE